MKARKLRSYLLTFLFVVLFGTYLSGCLTRYQITNDIVDLDGISRTFTMHRPTCNDKTIMVAVVLKDGHSWADMHHDIGFVRVKRNANHFLDMVQSFNYSMNCLSLAILVSDADEFDRISEILETRFVDLGHPRVTLVFRHFHTNTTRENRHEFLLQDYRRKMLAEARNYLSYVALRHESAVFWLDADVIKVPPDGLTAVLESQKEIVTMRCRVNDDDNYDLNAWTYDPDTEEIDILNRTKVLRLSMVMGSKERILPIQSIGGTNLYIKAELLRRGLVFPPMAIVGTRWKSIEGEDGIETEGLCYMAQGMGAQCYALLDMEIEHSPSI